MITIDNDLRTINIPSDTRLLGVVGDKDVNTLEFEMPRRYKGLDLSEYEIQIRYKNIERGRLRYMEGEYDPPNIVFNDEKINFYWVIGNDACSYRGIAEFSIFLEKDNCKFNTRWAALPVFEKQFPEVGHTVKDSELVEIDVGEMKFSVEDEILIMSRK